jgi:LCP family protein required for cell wall assembly
VKRVAKQVKKKIKKTIIFRFIFLIFAILSVVGFYFIYRIGILPFKYLLLLFLILFLINFILFRLIISKSWQKRMVGSFLCIIFSFMGCVGIFYETVTLDFFKNAFQSREKIENYQVLVLNDSNYGSLKEFKNGKIGVPRTNFSEGAKLLQSEIKSRTSLTLQETDNSTLVESLLKKNLRVIVMEESQRNLFCEMNDDFKNKVKVLETIAIKVENKVKKKDTKITKEPFSVYLSGTDDYGAINEVTRSDVNMVVTINPNTHQVLLTSIPRDYYVSLEGLSDAKDKLTHASLYGIDTSVKTLEKLLDTTIDYYLKINFSSLVNLVEAVGGIEVNNEEAFTAHYYDEPVNEWVTYHFSSGLNSLNGKQALAFSRERKSFALGDRTRALHQQQVLSALIKKVASPTILKNYTTILNALDGSFDTNFTFDEMMSFLQKQIDTGADWNISSTVLEGTDGNKHVYSMSGVTTYVMIPKEESVKSAQEEIKKVLS